MCLCPLVIVIHMSELSLHFLAAAAVSMVQTLAVLTVQATGVGEMHFCGLVTALERPRVT